MNINNKDLKKRIIDISFKNKLSHLGSCLSAVDIIKEIFETKKPGEKFILSSGHAGLGLYVVLEQYGAPSAEEVFTHHGVHPDNCATCKIDCSTGSLGQGLPIAIGMALSDRKKDIYCLTSDGELSEGSIWEALHVASYLGLSNLKIYVNLNKWGAYREIETKPLKDNLSRFNRLNIEIRETSVEQLPFLKGQDAHYKVMNEEDYKQAMELLSEK